LKVILSFSLGYIKNFCQLVAAKSLELLSEFNTSKASEVQFLQLQQRHLGWAVLFDGSSTSGFN